MGRPNSGRGNNDSTELHDTRLRSFGPQKKERLALASIMLLGLFLRFHQLDAIPVGLTGDEGADGAGAKRILRGEELPIFFTADFGEEPMHTYLVALSFGLWGVSLWSIRFVSALVGVLTIPVVYWLAKELFPVRERGSTLLGLLSAFLIATSYWHIIYSRAGLEVVTLPLFSSAVIYFLWRGIRSPSKWPFVVSGLILGTSLYAYRGARFLPIFLAVFFGGWLLTSAAFRRRHLANIVLLVAVAAVIFAPLGAYGVLHPDVFFAREMHVSIFNPEWGRGGPLQAFAVALVKTMGMFNFQGDPQFDRNPGRRAVLDPIGSLCFVLGLAVTLRRCRRPNYLLVLLWFLIMALPGAFTAEALPHFHRGIGALPGLCLLCAIGLASVKEWLEGRAWRLPVREGSWAIISLLLFTTAVLSYRDYFVPWEQRIAEGHVIGSTYMEAATVMNTIRIPGGVWILPATSLRPRNLPFYEVDFLYDGPEPEYTLNVDEESAPAELSRICSEHRQAAVVDWKYYSLQQAYLSLNSDPKGLLDFLLRKYGYRIEGKPFESFDLVTYGLPDSPAFAIAHAFEPMSVDFGDELRLVGIAVGGSSLHATSTTEEVQRKLLASGREAWVVLQWQATKEPGTDYKVTVHLLDRMGRSVGQVDKLLLSNELQPTSGWNVDQVEIDYYTLPSLPATPPGEYHIEVAAYDPVTMERLAVFDEQEGVTKSSVMAGTLKVVKSLAAPEVEPMVELVGAQGEIAPGIRLLGYDLPTSTVGPGERLSVALYWQALDDVRRDYLLLLALRDTEGAVTTEQKGRPVDDTYPTTEWTKGEVLRDWHDLALPPDKPQGALDMFVGILEGELLLGEVPLGEIEVQGRPREFAIPEIQYPGEAKLGGVVQFLGYDLESNEVEAGGTLQLTLYWRALEEMQVSYTVFTHLLDADERIWGQVDSAPRRGQAPTSSWMEGEVVADEYAIIVDAGAPPGEYIIEIGMYDPATGQRLSVYDSHGKDQGERLLLESARVISPVGSG